MPFNPANASPGVYVYEIPSGVRTITGVATSITAFIGRALRGPTDQDTNKANKALTINSFAEFQRTYGGLWAESTLGYTVRDFFLNGGSQAVIVRLYNPTFTDDELQNIGEVAAAATGATAEAAANAVSTKAAALAGAANATESFKKAVNSIESAASAAAAKAGATPQTVKEAAEQTKFQVAPPAKTFIEVGGLMLKSAYPGSWGKYLRATFEPGTSDDIAKNMGLTGKADIFSLTVSDVSPNGRVEQYQNLSIKDSPRRIDKILESESKLVRWAGGDLSATPQPTVTLATAKAYDKVTKAEKHLEDVLKVVPQVASDVQAAKADIETAKAALEVSDGHHLEILDFIDPAKEGAKQGLYALEEADLFNLLCIPPYTSSSDVEPQLVGTATAYCEKRRAMLLVDPPSSWKDKEAAKGDGSTTGVAVIGTNSKNAALFFPRLRQPNLLHSNQVEDFVPSGTVAGIFARTDAQRGVWKAPAGLDASLVGTQQLSVTLTDAENGELNSLGINCLRTFPVYGRVVWGSRTLRGADAFADEYKYIPVRRTALYIEESLYRGTQWVVFEPNDEPLWAQIRLNVGAFMHNLFRQGAFQGTTPREAYFVKCDRETTTQNDINLGIVNIVVGFAPLKPAEFVIIKLQQMAGQIEV